ncbi:MAG: response regulator [Lachnospiraceae bacterium]|jgi:two-component system chemotaxis response regulator CheY|nr:response regulator [Lachnospiraceae bacterium]
MAGILIVDDSRTSRKILRGVLESAGFTVVGEATNGEEGFEKYCTLQPDLVTMDVTMPQVDGLAALEKIRQYDPHAKVIMVTAAGQTKKIATAVRLGAVEYITKPFEAQEIEAMICKVLSHI